MIFFWIIPLYYNLKYQLCIPATTLSCFQVIHLEIGQQDGFTL